LTTITELVIAKLGIFAHFNRGERYLNARIGVLTAFVTLTDGVNQYLLAGSRKYESQVGAGLSDTTAKWLGDSDVNGDSWALLFTDIEKLGPEEPYSTISDLAKDSRFKSLPSVAGPPFLRGFVAVPIFTKLKVKIGSMIILDTAARGRLSLPEAAFLQRMAETCMIQLGMARETVVRKRTMDLNQGLKAWIQSQSVAERNPGESRQLKDPRTNEELRGDSGLRPASSQMSTLGHDIKEADGATFGTAELANPALGPVPHEAVASKLYGQSTSDPQKHSTEADPHRAETPYRRIFRLAAEHLRTSLNLDGVAFVDGIVGFHGELLPIAEPEQEIQSEMAQRPERNPLPGEHSVKDKAAHDQGTDAEPEPRFPKPSITQEDNVSTHRTFTSVNYTKTVLETRPAEVIGLSTDTTEKLPKLVALSESTKGMPGLNEGFLQEFMEINASGKVWYFDGNETTFYFENDVLIEENADSGAGRLRNIFPGVRQIIFAPLTDFTTFKRLAGCFAWTTERFPVFTDVADLVQYKLFLHSVEAEISRLDSMSALKQKESFVSSVSHELRTPLHGVLGALEFLEETNLDDFQRSLAHTIRFCGSTLHETLSNVLSYARINEFEHRNNKLRRKGSRESPWALLNKDEHTTPNQDFHGPFVSTNLASLCEEIVHVTESGRSYSGSSDLDILILTLNISYREKWDFVTEPGALRRILMNVIGNSLKYSSKGVVEVRLDAKHLENDKRQPGIAGSKSQRNLVTFTIKDSGKGMSKEFIQNHLFVPFTQENAAESEGVGLGMSIVKSLAALLGGQINVKSEVGKCTDIEISIPMEEGNPITEDGSSTSVKMERLTSELRERRLTVSVRGLSSALDESVRFYLSEWFKATVLREDAPIQQLSHTDILIVDEALTNDTEAMRSLVETHGHHLALLSINTNRKQRAELTSFEKSFPFLEKVQRPLSPGKLSKALLRCVQKLDSGTPAAPTYPSAESSEPSPVRKASFQLEKDDPDTSSIGADLLPYTIYSDVEVAALPASTFSEGPETPALPHVRNIFPQVSSAGQSSTRQKPSVLLVEDNAINLKLLQTFVNKHGVKDIQTAENGRAAINAVEQHVEGFDIIFMGKLIILSSP